MESQVGLFEDSGKVVVMSTCYAQAFREPSLLLITYRGLFSLLCFCIERWLHFGVLLLPLAVCPV